MEKLKVLVLHNHYQLQGGEDSVFAAESALLEEQGHSVVRLTAHNSEIAERSRIGMAVDTVWNQREYDRVAKVIREERPDILHCHNTFPRFSPAVYYSARRADVPVVQTLHNFRLTCVNGILFRDGKPCTACVGKFAPIEGAVRGCYRDDRAASSIAAGMVAVHKAARTYRDVVDRYIALTSFAREKFVESGLPRARIAVKPNFARDRGRSIGAPVGRRGFLYVGRLSAEKGCTLLVDAARRMRSDASITIVGDGPLRRELEEAALAIPRLRITGPLPPDAVHEQMQQALAVVIPSLCYEMFPVVAAEAYSAGTAVVASAHGGLASIVDDGRTGRLFAPGDATALAATLDTLFQSPDDAGRMGAAARHRYEAEYAPSANYQQLVAIYEDAIAARAAACA